MGAAPWYLSVLVTVSAGVMVAGVVGAAKWLAAVVHGLAATTTAVAGLTEKVESLTATAAELAKPIERLGRDLYRTQVDLRVHVREAEERWRALCLGTPLPHLIPAQGQAPDLETIGP